MHHGVYITSIRHFLCHLSREKLLKKIKKKNYKISAQKHPYITTPTNSVAKGLTLQKKEWTAEIS